jgi:hypothetical protein
MRECFDPTCMCGVEMAKGSTKKTTQTIKKRKQKKCKPRAVKR